MTLWDISTEKQFFIEALNSRFASPEKLFYGIGSEKYAYVPKNKGSKGETLQSRNSLIGNFTETWAKNIISPIARKLNLYAVNNVECQEIGLTKRSGADLALCSTDSKEQKAQNIKLIFEIKMSIVSNYKYLSSNSIEFVGDYKTHHGNPSLLRSDSMLKAIGKSINIRVSGIKSSKIPIIVLGNSPITKFYVNKVDKLKNTGVIQGFWSVNPKPTTSECIMQSKKLGFQTILEVSTIEQLIKDMLELDLNYFSSMIPQKILGEYINIASKEPTDEAKAEKFLSLIWKM